MTSSFPVPVPASLTSSPPSLVTVLGATGKTGRRVARRLAASGVPVRAGSRRADPPFDWTDRAGTYLFREVLDGRNERPMDGVERALGRPAKDFSAFARTAAAAGAWPAADASGERRWTA